MSGVICHHGVSGLGGHYTCYCYNANTGQWFHYDDSNVRLVDAATVASAEAYVLFYKKDPPAELEPSRAKLSRAPRTGAGQRKARSCNRPRSTHFRFEFLVEFYPFLTFDVTKKK